MEFDIYTITGNDHGRRIDRIVRKMFPRVPLSVIYKGIRKGQIRLNNRAVKQDTATSSGDRLYVAKNFEPGNPGNQSDNNNQQENENQLYNKQENDTQPEKTHSSHDRHKNKNSGCVHPLDTLILYENSHILALNKPRGLLVHGENSLETLVLAYLKNIIPQSLSFKPGPIHRLDRNTSGLVIFSKSLEGAKTFSEIIREDQCIKYYLGLFDRKMEGEEKWVDLVARDEHERKTIPSKNPEARQAIMKIFPLLAAKQKTLALCIIRTGITHQIRVQASIHKHPLTGDKKYGSGIFIPYYILHAWAIRFRAFNPVINRTIMTAPIPQASREKLCSLLGSTRVKAILSDAAKKMNAEVYQ